MIYLEVLQGAGTDSQYEAIKRVLSQQTMLEPMDSLETFEAAAQLYRTARTQGLTVRKPVDCLIAAIALEQRALLVHNDRDFLALATAVPSLVVYPSRSRDVH